MQIEIVEIKNLTPTLSEKLLGVWQSSVEATHAFLSQKEIQNIGRYVPSALGGVPRLIVAEYEGAPVAFAGVAGRKLEMLFVAAHYIPDGNKTNSPLNAAFVRLDVLPHCNASGHCRFVIAPIHPKIRYLRVRSNLKRADRFRYKAKPAGNSDPYCQGL